MSFADIKGQESAVSFLKSSIQRGKISHAYIFAGSGGIGKMLAAINFAKAMNCESMVSGEPCDACKSCKKIDGSNHPDVSIIRPEKEGGSIKIEAVRQLIKDIYLKPYEAEKKVYIIDSAEAMKHEAANALLKTLEEPPTDSVLILIADSLKSLFHTIVSRSQIVRFFPLKTDQIKEMLIKAHSLDEVEAHILSRLSGGSLGEALKFKDEDISSKRSYLLSGVSGESRRTLLDFDDIPKEDLKTCLGILLSWYSDILNAKIGADQRMLVNIDKKDIISNEAVALSFDRLEDTINSIMSTLGHLEQNANHKLAMNVLANKINAMRMTHDA